MVYQKKNSKVQTKLKERGHTKLKSNDNKIIKNSISKKIKLGWHPNEHDDNQPDLSHPSRLCMSICETKSATQCRTLSQPLPWARASRCHLAMSHVDANPTSPHHRGASSSGFLDEFYERHRSFFYLLFFFNLVMSFFFVNFLTRQRIIREMQYYFSLILFPCFLPAVQFESSG